VSAETVDQWAPRVTRELERMHEAHAAALAKLGESAVAAARRRAHRSVAPTIRGVATRDGIAMSSTHPAAAGFETGARVYGSPWLAIPLRDELRDVGPRSGPRLFVVRTRDGRRFLASQASGAIDIRWRLVRSIVSAHRPAILPAGREAAAKIPDTLAAVTTERLTRG
jgi:hypothetical protein